MEPSFLKLNTSHMNRNLRIWRRIQQFVSASTNDIFLAKLIETRKLWKETKVGKIFHMNYICILTESPLSIHIFFF